MSKKPLRLPPLPSRRNTSPAAWRGHAGIVPAVLFLLLMAAILIMPGKRPADDTPEHFVQSETSGYVAATRALAESGALTFQKGTPSSIRLDAGRLRQIGNDKCRPERPWFGMLAGGRDEKPGEDACDSLARAYKEKTYLGIDMAWASPTIWDMQQPGDKLDASGVSVESVNPLKAIKANARGLVESGYTSSTGNLYLSYWDQPKGRCNWQLRRLSGAGESKPIDSGIEAAGPDCPPLPGGGGTINGPCFDPAEVGVAITCFDGFALVVIPSGTRGIAIRGKAAAPGQHFVLREGDVISSGSGAHVVQLLRRRGMSELAPNGVRVRDLAYAGLASQFDRSEPARELKSSIRQRWDLRLQQVLDNALADADGQVTLRGAMLLMDGKTGEITATASFPHRPDQLAEGDGAFRRDWLTRNFAFENLPTGSIAKVPFAAAVVSAFPQLVDHKTPYAPSHVICYSTFQRSIECPAGEQGVTWSDHSGSVPGEFPVPDPETVNFERFIAYSNNFYAMTLVRQARIRADAQALPLPWENRLRNLACAWPHSIPGVETSSPTCPIYLWRDSRDPQRGHDFRGLVIPESDTWDEQNNIFLGVLGNGNYNWTTVQLAQAYARIVSGQDVTPTMLQQGGTPVRTFTGMLQPAIWQRLMTGLAGVISTGTARGIFDPLSLPANVWLYGKTGTSTLDQKVNGRFVTRYGRSFVLAVAHGRKPLSEPMKTPARPEGICGLKIVVFNGELHGNKENIGALAARELLNDAAIGPWLKGKDDACSGGGA